MALRNAELTPPLPKKIPFSQFYFKKPEFEWRAFSDFFFRSSLILFPNFYYKKHKKLSILIPFFSIINYKVLRRRSMIQMNVNSRFWTIQSALFAGIISYVLTNALDIFWVIYFPQSKKTDSNGRFYLFSAQLATLQNITDFYVTIRFFAWNTVRRYCSCL